MKQKVNLDMVDNGLDFILKSLETIDKSDKDLKYSIINLHAGIQLLLKELLYQEHWSLIFERIEQADGEKLKSGDFISVKHDTLILRLQKIGRITLDKDLLKEMEWLRKERNKIEHYRFVVSDDVLKSRIVKLLSHLIPFIKSEMVEENLINFDDGRYTEIIEYLNDLDEYIKERLRILEDKIKNVGVILQCPVCFQETVKFIDETDAFCYFCDEDIDNFTKEYTDNFVDTYGHVTGGGEDPLNECPDCEMDTFICIDGYQFICLTCGIRPTQDDLTTCDGPRCNGKIVYKKYDNEAHFCDYCMDYFHHA